MFISIISFIFVFVIAALTHELGHFIWAKKSGIRVLELGIGFGPTLFKFTRNNTKYSINLIPILAFVRLAGIDEENESEKGFPESEKYYTKNPWQKFKSISAGPIMNLILGFIIISLMTFFYGNSQISPEIAQILPSSPAHAAGLKKGDIITKLNGKNVSDMMFVISRIHASPGKNLGITVNRNGRELVFRATPKYNPKLKIGLLGFSLKSISKKVGFLSSFWVGANKTSEMIIQIMYALGGLLIGKIALSDLAGPIGIAKLSGEAATQGFQVLLYFLALININLGVLNLLPIPALDGGRLVFVALEAIRRKALKIETENKIHQVGLVLLLTLLAVVSFNDIARIFSSR